MRRRSLLGDLTVKLKAWTGRNWMVSLSREEGGQTLAELEASKRETAMLDARNDPAVAAMLARFPGARIIDVRIPDAPEAEAAEAEPARPCRAEEDDDYRPKKGIAAMKDLLGLMSKAKEMQAKFQAMQEEIAAMEATGQSGGGLVRVTLSGKFEMRSLKVDTTLMRPDEGEILEDLIVAAHNDAKAKVEALMQEKTRDLTAGLPLPPGMKLPFWAAFGRCS